MVTERLSQILRSKSDFSPAEIAAMNDADGWKWVRSQFNSQRRPRSIEVCFTGFTKAEREDLAGQAEAYNMRVVESVTKNLKVLCIGETPGPAKVEKARQQKVTVMTAGEFKAWLREYQTQT